MSKYYFVTSFGQEEPKLYGPYQSYERRDQAAQKMFGQGIQPCLRLEIDEDGIPSIGGFENIDREPFIRRK